MFQEKDAETERERKEERKKERDWRREEQRVYESSYLSILEGAYFMEIWLWTVTEERDKGVSEKRDKRGAKTDRE